MSQTITINMVGAPNGVASLDSNGKVPASQLPAGILSAGAFQAYYNGGEA